MSDENPPISNNLAIGIMMVLAAGGLGYFTYLHRPPTDIVDVLTRSGQWCFQQTPYYIVQLIAVLIGLAGIFRVVKARQ